MGEPVAAEAAAALGEVLGVAAQRLKVDRGLDYVLIDLATEQLAPSA